MRIDYFDWRSQFVEKLFVKHGVVVQEVEEIFFNQPRIRKVAKGHTKGEDVYHALGQSDGGRYLAVFFIYKPQNKVALILSARDMDHKERRQYGRKRK